VYARQMRSEFPRRTRPHSQSGPQRARSRRDARPLQRPEGHREAAEQIARPANAAPTARAGSGSRSGSRLRGSRALLWFVRHGIASAVALAGVVAMTFGTDTSLVGGAGLIGAGIAIWLVNWLYRVGVGGDRAREEEDRARRHFERHGHWPEDRGGRPATRP